LESVSFGLNLSNSFPLGTVSAEPLIQAARQAEQAGLAAVWVGDHILWHVPILEPMTMLAAVAASTSRIRLGTSVLLAPLRNPVVLAKTASTLDVVSGGG